MATAVVFGGLTAHAATTTRRYNAYAGALWAVSASVLFLVLSGVLFRGSAFGMLVEGVLGLVAGVYVLIDTQLILNKDGISKEDYIIGAMMIYSDLIQLFIKLLRLFGEKKEKK